MTATREDVAREAITWLGTPYHHLARVKGVGVDCAQLPAAVYHAVGLIPNLEPVYSPQWMKHHDEEVYLSWVRRYARDIERDAVGVGDLIMWKYGRVYSHSAIVIDPPTIIHAMARGRRVDYGDMDRDAELTSRPALYFSLFDQ